MKYVVVSGGVVSGLGKGITSSSVGLLLKESGLRVTSIKIDPYLNIDAGTMSPYEHGEVYVLDDGGEVDLDLGNYERFLGTTLTRAHNITTGKIYQQVMEGERKGEYLGKTVQVVPHVTDAIQQWIERVAVTPVDGTKSVPDVCMIELGGTVGDIESMVFLEALRQFRFRVGFDNLCWIHVSLVPVVGAVGEPKTKPTQHGIRTLMAAGITPDMLVCRSSQALDRNSIGKISMFCMVPATHVVCVHDVSNIYKVPLMLLEQKVPALVMGCLRINRMAPAAIPSWAELARKVDFSEREVTIGLVGKYTGLSDSYLSVTKALTHSAIHEGVRLKIEWIDSTHLEPAFAEENKKAYEAAWKLLEGVDGILIPGGFGDRGVEGKILACQWARLHSRPFLGVCLGLQVAVIEHARHVMSLAGANSTEFDEETEHPVVVYMPEVSQTHMGGTMRLGARSCKVEPGSLAAQLYSGAQEISERHRHRYEVNPDYVDSLQGSGLVFSGKDGVRMEILELPASQHPFFFATQFHPEFTSRPLRPSPPFLGLVSASAGNFSRRTAAKRKTPTAAATAASKDAGLIAVATNGKRAASQRAHVNNNEVS